MARKIGKTMLVASAVTASLAIGLPLAGLGWMKTSRLRGEYIELGYGLFIVPAGDFNKLLHERHPEAQFISVAGCVVSADLQEYVQGYNGYAARAAMLHFGHDVFGKALHDTAKAYETKQNLNSVQ
jgi:hypothetical protein